MRLDEAFVFGYFLVFLRCSAVTLTVPGIGGNSIPVMIRIFASGVFSAAILPAVGGFLPGPPGSVPELMLIAGREVISGLLIGGLFSMTLQSAQIAGTIMDQQAGLSMSQVINPVSGISVSVLAQFKLLLATAVFMAVDGHHIVFEALVSSYRVSHPLTMDGLPGMQADLVSLIVRLTWIGVQMALPVAAACFVVDAALAVVGKAVPQLQVFIVGVPAKLILGLMLLAVGLPATAAGVRVGLDEALRALGHAFGGT